MSQATEPMTENAAPEAQLQIGDIEAAVKVIDYASEQGAFKGWQVVQEVLVLRNRLVTFVRAVAPPEAAPEAEASSVVDANTVTPDAASEVPESPAA